MSAYLHIQTSPARNLSLARVPGNFMQRKCACGGAPSLGDTCEMCRQKDPGLQRFAAAPGGLKVAPPIVEAVLNEPGRPLDGANRGFMERRFGHDFSEVRIHADPRAAWSAQAVNAHAFTVGRHIVFGPGQYPRSDERGRKLLAHELAHVIQQGNTRVRSGLQISNPAEAAEQEADRTASQVLGSDAPAAQLRSVFPSQARLMRDFDSTINICRELLNSRTFHVDTGNVVADLYANWIPPKSEGEDSEIAPASGQCTIPYYLVTLVRSGTFVDSDIATEPVPVGRRTSRTWSGLADGDYFIRISTGNTNGNCCLDGSISVQTSRAPADATVSPLSLPSTACYDGDTMYVIKDGRSHSCPALTGSIGEPTPPGRYCIRRQGEAQIRGGLKGALLQDRPSWFLLEPQFETTRTRMQLHPGTMSSGCITVTDRGCFDKLASVLNSGDTTTAIGSDGYPPGNAEGVHNEPHEVKCVGILTVGDADSCTQNSRSPD